MLFKSSLLLARHEQPSTRHEDIKVHISHDMKDMLQAAQLAHIPLDCLFEYHQAHGLARRRLSLRTWAPSKS